MKIDLDSRPPHGEDHQDLLTEKIVQLVSSLVVNGSCIFLCVHGSSICVTISCWFSDSLVFPLVISLVSPLVFLVFFVGSAIFMKDRPLGFLPYINDENPIFLPLMATMQIRVLLPLLCHWVRTPQDRTQC